MDLPGPLSISSLRSASNADPVLRPFQRLTAQVLAVTGTSAVLAIEGHPVVAHLTSTDQAAALLSQRTAQFIVTKLGGQEVTLQLIRPEQARADAPSSNRTGGELAVQLLEQHNIPVNPNNLVLARAVLNQGLPLTPGLLQELLRALSASGAWGQAQAELAAALKAAGLPVTPASLALAARQAAQTGEALGQLISRLQTTGQNLPPELLKQINENLQLLEELVVSVDGNTSRLALQLKTAIAVLGQSVESALLEKALDPDIHPAGKSILSLSALGQRLGEAGEAELAEAVEKFLSDLRRQQFLNAKPESSSGQEGWLEIGFRLGGERGANARLRINRDTRTSSLETSPASTHLVLQVDISQDETVEVHLAMAGNQISTQVTAQNPVWCQQAERELPSLEEALQAMGYTIKENEIILGKPQRFEALKLSTSSVPLMRVNIEV